MLIEEELLAYLETSIREGENKARDKQIIAFYYGFGDVAWPTLEQVANQFGLNERERVRQIIKDKFQKHVNSNTLARASRLAELIQQLDFVSSESIRRLLIEERLAPEGANLRGLLNLLEDLGLCLDFDIYDALLRPVSRSMASSDESAFLIRESQLPRLRKALKVARTLPGLIGLAHETYLETALHDVDESTRQNVQELLRSSRDCCYIDLDGQTWFCVEGRDNTLINSCEKIFGVIDSCESAVLAEVLANSLYRRASKFEYPNALVIERFLSRSSFFVTSGSLVSFRGQSTQLTDMESDVVAYLRDNGIVSYPTIKSFLAEKGYGSPHIVKATTASPLVYVNKAGGRSRYTYQLVPAGSALGHDASEEARYLAVRARLQKLFELGTDVSSESTRRREQGILQDWLFDGKEVEKCAICDRMFSSSALVAAHKKKRSLCSENERLDPHVVMPLCVFGCDYLYENGILVISGETIELGAPMASTHEALFASSLAGRKIQSQWLRGDPSYFARAQLNSTPTKAQESLYAEA